MNESHPRIQRFSIDDPKTWRQIGDQRLFVADVLDSRQGAKVNAGFARADRGVRMEIAFPHDEVLVVTRGSAVLDHQGHELTVQGGDLVFLPRGVTGVLGVAEDIEAVYVTYPPYRQVITQPGRDGVHAQKFAIEDRALGWMQVAGQHIYLSDTVGDAPGFAMETGFARVGQGETMKFAFPYDEVLVATNGRFTVRTENGSFTAEVGDFIYLPTGAPGTFYADEDADMANVLYPPYVETIIESGRALGTDSPGQEKELVPFTPPWLT